MPVARSSLAPARYVGGIFSVPHGTVDANDLEASEACQCYAAALRCALAQRAAPLRMVSACPPVACRESRPLRLEPSYRIPRLAKEVTALAGRPSRARTDSRFRDSSKVIRIEPRGKFPIAFMLAEWLSTIMHEGLLATDASDVLDD
jgi:hypothetical protein